MKKHWFNLQLFNENSQDAGATVTDSGTYTGPEPVEKVALDEDGQVRVFYEERDISSADGKREQSQGNGAADPDAGEGKRPPEKEQAGYYTPDEVRATDFEKLDPAKLPPEMMPWYKSMQAGFTRKTQELAQERKVIHEFAGELAERLKQQDSQPKQPDARQFYAQQHTFLRNQVATLFGLEAGQLADNLKEWPTELQLAYNDIRGELQAAAKRQQEAREQELRLQREEAEKQVALLADLDTTEVELRGIDNEAYEFAITKLQNGEVLEKDKKAIKQALLKGDKDTVKKYFEQYRKEYHAGKAGISTGEKVREKSGPARLEGSGAGGSLERHLPPDYAELGKLQSFDDKLAWMRKHNIKP